MSEPLDERFRKWWNEDGVYYDPDTEDVSWYDKRQGLAAYAYVAGEAESTRLRERVKAMEAALRESICLMETARALYNGNAKLDEAVERARAALSVETVEK